MDAENVSGRANKVDAILSFLEGCDSSQQQPRQDLAIEHNLTPESPTSLLNVIKTQVVDLKLQLKKEKNVLERIRERHAVELEQKELLWSNEKKELQRTSLLQKEEYEKALNRQLEFVDKLLVDKTNLTQKGDQLMKQIEVTMLIILLPNFFYILIGRHKLYRLDRSCWRETGFGPARSSECDANGRKRRRTEGRFGLMTRRG